jgi:hypothetical protein
LQSLKDPETRAALDKIPYLSQQYQEMQKAEKLLEQQVERMSGMKGLTANTLEGKLNALKSGKKLFAKQMFEHIPGMNDMSIPEIMRLINIREAFEKGHMNGSRNVNLWHWLMGGIGSAVGSIFGHSEAGVLGGGMAGSAVGAAVDKEGGSMTQRWLDSYLDKYGDLPKAVGASRDVTREALGHFLKNGEKMPPSATGFKASTNYINAAKRGGYLLNNAAKALFGSAKVLPHYVYPDDDKMEKLNEKAKELQSKPRDMFALGGEVGTYMPKHGEALGKMMARSVSLINQHRPSNQKNAFFDSEMKPNADQKSEFHRGLKIAEQPLHVLEHIQKHTLLPQDVAVLQNLHPEYYQRMKGKISEAMVSHIEKGGKIPYAMRQGLSMFLGQDLDSAHSQPNIAAAQMSFLTQGSNPEISQKTSGGGNKEKLSEIPKQYRTQEQSLQQRQANNV